LKLHLFKEKKLNEYLARHADKNDDINEVWTLLKNVITQTADAILKRVERVTYKDWFDAECEETTISKNKAYKGMQQRNHTRKAGIQKCQELRKKSTQRKEEGIH
jgi:hypothetical protein